MVYLAHDGEIIADGLETTIRGKRYVIDISDAYSVKAYRLSNIVSLGDTFDFIVRYYPDYEHSDEAGWMDDLDCIIAGECDEEKVYRVTLQWGSDPDVWQEERDHLFASLLQGAIDNYKHLKQ